MLLLSHNKNRNRNKIPSSKLSSGFALHLKSTLLFVVYEILSGNCYFLSLSHHLIYSSFFPFLKLTNSFPSQVFALGLSFLSPVSGEPFLDLYLTDSFSSNGFQLLRVNCLPSQFKVDTLFCLRMW